MMFSRFSKQTDDLEKKFRNSRLRMVSHQIVSRDVANELVLEAMRKVPRHLFVPKDSQNLAYEDGPLSIGYGQTISQPYIVASMTENIDPDSNKNVLEIGTGSGYQTAILAEVLKKVYTVEFIDELSTKAEKIMKKLGYTNVEFYIGNGLEIPKNPPEFDAIIVTAAPEKFPNSLVDRLKIGCKLIVPVGSHIQSLKLVSKNSKGQVRVKDLYSVRFVPLVGND